MSELTSHRLTDVHRYYVTPNQNRRWFLHMNFDSNLEADKTFVELLGKDPSSRYRFIMDASARAVVEELDV